MRGTRGAISPSITAAGVFDVTQDTAKLGCALVCVCATRAIVYACAQARLLRHELTSVCLTLPLQTTEGTLHLLIVDSIVLFFSVF